MKRYLRRLWAALCGRTLGPVEIGQTFWLASPAGTPMEFQVTCLTYQQDTDRIPRVNIEAGGAAMLRMRNRV